MAAATTKQKQLTPVQRAAAVVIALGADRASEVYRYLKDDEVEQISLEIAKLNRLSPEDMQSTIEDFYGLCVTQKVITEGGVLYAKDVLEKAFGPEQASSYMDRLSKSLRTRSFESIRKADYKNLWMILQNEHPQTHCPGAQLCPFGSGGTDHCRTAPGCPAGRCGAHRRSGPGIP